MANTLSRRSFLKAGIVGALALATAGGIYRMTRQPATLTPYTLDGDARTALGAIASVMLDGALRPGTSDIQAAVQRTQDAIHGLPLNIQKEVQDLFALLTLGPTRRFLVGLPDDWAQAKREDIAAFLQNWRTHRLQLLQAAYQALHELVAGPWYADESTWASIGYPGPIKELS
ncbi:twin-arginine translocation signal domain-containing protein [Noviherbaspirillum massiliense]|uniref:twin-arginine translocation signal domain-containing protein n=1 Tax=Noviherbaspirillum massiliense TaxID=1465823 RepID=UPI0002E12BCA|nr:twin-arginine translocation signal domain-containing protein [Noviherbaspirillum massiliense]